tara:strand:- start:1200 stop:1403 length:204 start_codon:yes stop_codon:yes gene_type:complete
MTQRIKITIDQDGTVREEVQGVQGDVCESITRDLEARLGELEDRVYKAEYYQQKNVTLQHNKNEIQG